MAASSVSEVKRAAKQRGVPWAAVRGAYQELKASESERREHPNQVRAAAWCVATARTPGCWPFWRHGFLSRWGHKLAQGHDYTSIPGYDTISQEIGWMFPEYTGDDGTERLWDFLLSAYDRMPSSEQLYRRALDRAHRELTANQVPF